MVLQSGRKKEVILRSPDRLPKNFTNSDPPFHFTNTPPKVREKFFDLVSAYYRRVIDDTSDTDQPLSRAAYLVIEALQSSIDVQILALAVAADALIRQAFPDIVIVDRTLKEQVLKFNGLLQQLDLEADFKERIAGAVKPMLSASSSDRLHNFIKRYHLDSSILRAWKDSRNPSAHGNFVDLSTFPEILSRRNKVLYLCHAIVLAFIDYQGPHTRYDISGYPHSDWPLAKNPNELAGEK
jgi:hypothetical protein